VHDSEASELSMKLLPGNSQVMVSQTAPSPYLGRFDFDLLVAPHSDDEYISQLCERWTAVINVYS